jgi:hypothetical protein
VLGESGPRNCRHHPTSSERSKRSSRLKAARFSETLLIVRTYATMWCLSQVTLTAYVTRLSCKTLLLTPPNLGFLTSAFGVVRTFRGHPVNPRYSTTLQNSFSPNTPQTLELSTSSRAKNRTPWQTGSAHVASTAPPRAFSVYLAVFPCFFVGHSHGISYALPVNGL